MTIKVELRNIYGATKAYPACPRATAFANIAGTKTLTPATLRGVHALGEAIEFAGRDSFTLPPDMPAQHAHAAVTRLQLA